jgi:hypothetical protein
MREIENDEERTMRERTMREREERTHTITTSAISLYLSITILMLFTISFSLTDDKALPSYNSSKHH